MDGLVGLMGDVAEERMIELVVLDLVGTLVADDGQVEQAFESALSAHGLAMDGERLTDVRGLRKRDAIRRLTESSGERAPALAEQVYEGFKARLSLAYRERPPRMLPGAAEFLEWAAERGVKVAVNTGLDRDLAGLLLAGFRRAIDAVVTGDDVAESRPAPDLIFRAMETTRVFSVNSVAVVGDTAADLRAGGNAGVRLNIGALSGAHTRAQLECEPHTHLIEHLGELPALLAGVADMQR